MAVVTVFRFEDVSRATISAFAGSSSKMSSVIPMLLPPVVDAFALQVNQAGRPCHRSRSSRQQQQQCPSSLSLRARGLFQSRDIDDFNNNDATTIQQYPRTIVNDQRLVEDLRAQHFEMQKMMKQQQPTAIKSSLTTGTSIKGGTRFSSAVDQ